MLLKKEIRPTIMGDGAGREHRLRRRGSGSLVGRLSSQFLCDFHINFGFKMHHDQATIAPRSGHDRSPGHASHALRSSGKNSTLKEQRSRLDRAAIAVRSGRDIGVLPQAFNAVRFNLQVDGRSRSLDRVNPDYESRPPSDGRRSRC